jgi:hypothetical protein
MLLILSVILNAVLIINLMALRNDNRNTLYREWVSDIETDIRTQRSYLDLLTSGEPNSIALLEQVFKSNIQNYEQALEDFRSESIPR